MGVEKSVVSVWKLIQNITSETTHCAWSRKGLSTLYLKQLFSTSKTDVWIGPNYWAWKTMP